MFLASVSLEGNIRGEFLYTLEINQLPYELNSNPTLRSSHAKFEPGSSECRSDVLTN